MWEELYYTAYTGLIPAAVMAPPPVTSRPMTIMLAVMFVPMVIIAVIVVVFHIPVDARPTVIPDDRAARDGAIDIHAGWLPVINGLVADHIIDAVVASRNVGAQIFVDNHPVAIWLLAGRAIRLLGPSADINGARIFAAIIIARGFGFGGQNICLIVGPCA